MKTSKKILTIGVWGNYNYGNWGDDLMAVMIANYIKKKGHQPIVYRLDGELSSEYNLPTEYDVKKLVEVSDFLLIGGGGMLVGNKLLKRWLSPIARKFENDFKELNEALEKFNKNIYPISIGGEEKAKVNLSKHRYNFFKSKYIGGGTLRLKGDVSFISEMNNEFEHHPDILYDTVSHFDIVKKENSEENSKTWIALNLINDGLQNEKWHTDLIAYAKKNKNIKLTFVKTHLENYNLNYEFISNEITDNVNVHQYTSIDKTLEFLANVDIVISSKLHLGLTALSLGTPFISYKGKGKTISALKSIGGEKAIIKEGFSIDKLLDYCKPENRIIKKLYNQDLYDEMVVKSKKHFEFIDRIVEKQLK